MLFELFSKDLIFYLASFLEISDVVVCLSHINIKFYETLTGKESLAPIGNKPYNFIKKRAQDEIIRWFIEEGHIPTLNHESNSLSKLTKELSYRQSLVLLKEISRHKNIKNQFLELDKNQTDLDLYHQKIKRWLLEIKNYLQGIPQLEFNFKLTVLTLLEANISLNSQTITPQTFSAHLQKYDQSLGLTFFIILGYLKDIAGADTFHVMCYETGLELAEGTSLALLTNLAKVNSLNLSSSINKFSAQLIKTTGAEIVEANIQLFESFIRDILTKKYFREQNTLTTSRTYPSTLYSHAYKRPNRPKLPAIYAGLSHLLSDKTLLNEFIKTLTQRDIFSKTLPIKIFFNLAQLNDITLFNILSLETIRFLPVEIINARTAKQWKILLKQYPNFEVNLKSYHRIQTSLFKSTTPPSLADSNEDFAEKYIIPITNCGNQQWGWSTTCISLQK